MIGALLVLTICFVFVVPASAGILPIGQGNKMPMTFQKQLQYGDGITTYGEAIYQGFTLSKAQNVKAIWFYIDKDSNAPRGYNNDYVIQICNTLNDYPLYTGALVYAKLLSTNVNKNKVWYRVPVLNPQTGIRDGVTQRT